jgi:hypothetical protein
MTRVTMVAFVALAALACRTDPPLLQVAQARDRSADLAVQFVTAADSANKAIMAESDEASAAFVRQAEAAKQAVRSDIESLQPVLLALHYTREGELLRAFAAQFADYSKLDEQILVLATENTNRKAQRLSFGPGMREADAFRDAIDALARAAGADAWRIKALAATAIAAVREIQALQAPHIAEAGDAAMTAMETRMAAAEASARGALRELAPLVGAPPLATANASFDRFMRAHAEITALSRRNTNVRSLALALNEKGKLTGACEDSVSELRAALAKRRFSATR